MPRPTSRSRVSRAQERRDYTLSEFRGQKVVIAFYPGDFTPG